MKVTSSGVENGGKIDQQSTADVRDVSPPLEWFDAPAADAYFSMIS